MSAYMVDREHIDFLVHACLAPMVLKHYSAFCWWHNGKRRELSCGATREELAAVGQMLWDENARSVRFRYPDCSDDDLPGPIGESMVYEPSPAQFWSMPPLEFLVAVFKACDCYNYQACETPDWEQSEAFAFIQALRCSCWRSLPGYEDADWGAPAPSRS